VGSGIGDGSGEDMVEMGLTVVEMNIAVPKRFLRWRSNHFLQIPYLIFVLVDLVDFLKVHLMPLYMVL